MNTDLELEYTSCPLCGSSERKKAYYNFNPYKVVKCRVCNFYYLSPRPTENFMMQLYSQDNYFEGDGYDSYIDQELALRATFSRLLHNMKKRNIVGGSLLEIGCGYGYLLEEAKYFFDERTGTDFSRKAVEQSKYRADRVYQGGIDQIPHQEKFDCIISTQVIEHIYQPKIFLKKLTSHLNLTGVVVIAAPDMGSFWRVLMGNKWPSFKLPEHILYFTQKTLFKMMSESGISNIQRIPYTHAFPLPLIAAKLNIKLPQKLKKINLWIPYTTIALYGNKK